MIFMSEFVLYQTASCSRSTYSPLQALSESTCRDHAAPAPPPPPPRVQVYTHTTTFNRYEAIQEHLIKSKSLEIVFSYVIFIRIINDE